MPIARTINNMQLSLAKISTYPVVGLNILQPLATIHIIPPNNALEGIIIQGATGQTADLFTVLDGTGATDLFTVSANGNTYAYGILSAGTGPTTITDATGKIVNTALPVVDIAHGGLGASSLTANSILAVNAGGTAVAGIVGTSSGQILTWNNATSTWGPQAQAGGGNVSSGSSGATSTTGNIVKWLGTNLASDSVITEYVSGGASLIGINKAIPTGKLHIKSALTGTHTLFLERMSGQTGDLLRWVAEDGTTVIGNIAANGTFGLGGAAQSNSLVTASGSVSITGSDLYGWNAGSFTLQPATGYSAYFNRMGGIISSGAGITNPAAYGVYVGTVTKTGTGIVTTAYGAYINAPTAGAQNIAAYLGGQVQIGTAFATNAMVTVGGSVPLLASNGSYGASINTTLNPDNTTSATIINLNSTVNVTGSNTATFVGVQINTPTLTGGSTAPNPVTIATGVVVLNPTIGAINYAADLRGQVGVGGGVSAVNPNALLSLGGSVTGNASQAFGLYESVTLTPASAQNAIFSYFGGSVGTGSSTTTGTSLGVYVGPITKTGTGTIPLSYGIYVSPSTHATTNYSGYFGGRVGINSATPNAMLHVITDSTSSPAMITQGIGGMTRNIHEWYASTAGGATAQVSVTGSGTFFVNPTNPNATNIISRGIGAVSGESLGGGLTIQNLFDAQNNAGVSLVTILPYGSTVFAPTASGVSNIITKTNSAATQYVFEWQNNAGVTQGYINAAGTVSINPTAPLNPLMYLRGIASATQDYLQIQNSTPATIGNINSTGNYGIGAANTTKRIRMYLAGSLDGTAESSNTVGVYAAHAHTTSPGGLSTGILVAETVTAASGTTNKYVGVAINGASQSGAGTYSTSYGLQVTGSAFATANYAASFMTGNVGFGTLTPATTVEVVGTTKTTNFQMTNGAQANYILQAVDNTGAAVWAPVPSSSGLWIADTYGFHAPGTNQQIGIGANSGQNSQILIAGTVPILASNPSYGIYLNTTLTPAGTQNAYGIVSTPIVATGTGLTIPSVMGVYSGAIVKSGSGTITNTYAFYGAASSSGTNNYGAYFAGNVGINNASPAFALDVTGTGNFTGRLTATNFTMTTGAVAGDILQSDASGNATWVTPNTTGQWIADTYGFTAPGTNGQLGIGAATAQHVQLNLAGSPPTVAGQSPVGMIISTTLTPPDTFNAYGSYHGITINAVSGRTVAIAAAKYVGAMIKTGTGTITNTYGLYIASTAIGTNNYGAYIAGSVGIGTATPTVALDVTGSIKASANITVVGTVSASIVTASTSITSTGNVTSTNGNIVSSSGVINGANLVVSSLTGFMYANATGNVSTPTAASARGTLGINWNDFGTFFPGIPPISGNGSYDHFGIAHAINISSTPTSGGAHVAKWGTIATASTVFSITKNGLAVGTITFPTSGTSGTVAMTTSPTAFAAGDILAIVAPSTADATLADVVITLIGDY